MARIEIIEQDRTGISGNIETENIVYVPGYAKQGIINKPTLVRSYTEFITLFGNSPYIFSDLSVEKSWIYASELLRAGMPVLYERLYTKAETNKAEKRINITDDPVNHFKLKAKYVGSYGEEIAVKLVSSGSVIINNISTQLYTLTLNGEVFSVSFDKRVGSTYIGNVLKSNKDVDFEEVFTSPFEFGSNNSVVVFDDKLKITGGSANADMTYEDIITKLSSSSLSPIDSIADYSLYDVKFITTGGYPNIGDSSLNPIALKMINSAAIRGDALALIDMVRNTPKSAYKTIITDTLTYGEINGADKNTFATMIAPNIKVNIPSISRQEWMPGSFGYLISLGNSLVNNPIWFAVAGANRGKISNLVEPEFEIDNATLESWQFLNQCINPIRYIKPYGYVIDGNRTLKVNEDIENIKALGFTNVRVLSNEIKKAIRIVANGLAYESNDVILWTNFKSRLEPLLDQMQTGRGIEGYKLTRLQSTQRGVVKGSVKVLPIEAAESFELNFSLEDSLTE